MPAESHYPLPWQSQQWSRLQANAQQQKLAHALLLTGRDGVGKRGFALAFCHYLLCQNANEQGACSKCKACRLLAVGNHPDLHLVTLEEKAQAIKINQVRELVVALAKTPQIGSRHCVIIEPADCLNVNAANALLKLLEEPPGQAVMILVSAHPNRLMATIRSRCRQLPMAIPANDEALKWLHVQGLNPEVASKALSLARGAPLKALALYREEGLEDYQAIAGQLVGVLSRHISVVEAAADYANRPQAEVADFMLDWLCIAAKQEQVSGDSVYLPKALREYLALISDGLALFRFYDKLCIAKAHLLSNANPNKQLLWEECLMDWQALIGSARHSTSGATKVAN